MPPLPRPSSCLGCPAYPHTSSFMQAEGTGLNGVMIVGEALGDREAEEGLPFRPRGAAGWMLTETMKAAGVQRDAFSITNCLHCQPPKNVLEHQPWELGAIQHCKANMDREVAHYQPKVILALGGTALRTMTGYYGQKKSITNVRGYYLNGTRYPLPVVSSYHPAFIARDKQNLLGVLRIDILHAVALAKAGGEFFRPARKFIKFPGITVAEQWLEFARQHPELPINYDIETDDSILGVDEADLKVTSDGALTITHLDEGYREVVEEERPQEAVVETEIVRNMRITQIQFSILGDGDAIVVPWDNGPFSEFAKKVMALPNEKHSWNGFAFDDPILRQHGTVLNGQLIDLMWAWHHLQPDLPRGLQYATSFYIPEAEPWKHRAGEDAGEYGGCDVSLPRAYGPRLLDNLRQRGLWAGFERHVLRLWPILSAAAKRGIPVDDSKRIALGERVDGLRALVDAELQQVFPDELRGCEPKNGYVRSPFLIECPTCKGKKKITPLICTKIDEENKIVTFNSFVKGKLAKKVTCPHCEGAGKVEDEQKAKEPADGGERWVRRAFPAPKGGAGSTDTDTSANSTALADNCIQGTLSSNDGAPPKEICVWRWCRLQPFLPNSSPQILRYIKWKREKEIAEKVAGYMGNARFAQMAPAQLRAMAERNCLYYVPKKFKEDKDTTAKKELERLGAKTKDPFFSKVIEHREYGKIRSAYVDGWAPAEDGRVHTTFSFGPATGQLSSARPATMTVPKPGGRASTAEARKTELAESFREIIVAPPGYRLIEADKRAYHAATLGFNARDLGYMRLAAMDIHSFVTANVLWGMDRNLILNAKLPPKPENWTMLPDEELAQVLGKVKKNWKAIRDKKSKPCIAEDELVLTDKGLVPIQNITLDHRLWDGVEWVTHSGVVCQGVKEVITHEGLTATPEHEVVTADGNSLPIRIAAQRLVRLENTGNGGTPIRSCHRDFLQYSAQRRWKEATDLSSVPMSGVRDYEMDSAGLLAVGFNDWMPIMRAAQVAASGRVGATLRCNDSPLLQSKEPCISPLWRSGDHLHVPEPQRICAMGCEELAPQGLQGDRDRSDQQRWPLHAGESATGNTQGSDAKSQDYSVGSTQKWQENYSGDLRQPIHIQLDSPTSSARLDSRGYHNQCIQSGPREFAQTQDVEATSSVVRIARVYDIVNAGPRYCYTVSGKLVFNCILGIGLGMGDNKCFEMNKKEEINPMGFDSVAEVKRFKDVLKGLFPAIFRFQNSIRATAHQQGFLKSRHGFMRWFFNVYQKKDGVMQPGRDSEAAIAFFPQNDAHGMLKEEMLTLEEMGAMERFGFINVIHDCLKFCCREELVDDCIETVAGVMNAPSKILVDREICPDGFIVKAEVQMGRNWRDKSEVNPEGMEMVKSA